VITGVLVTGFILAMILWWGSQGIFTAFLHLTAVIAAGAIAFAVWEPIGIDLLLPRQGDYARGVALLSSFLLALLLIRACYDNLIKFNMKFNQVANLLGGGLCGFFTGVLTSGIMIIGMSMMPIGDNLYGYKPYIVGTDGKVGDNQKLFPFAVHEMTASFYQRLSNTSFSSDTPLSDHHPELVKQAFLYRIVYDPNSTLSAHPDAIKVTQVYELNTPVKEFSNDMAAAIPEGIVAKANHKLYGIEIDFNKKGAADPDGTTRIPPTQIRLQVASPKNESGNIERTLLAPLGFSVSDSGKPIYHPIVDAADSAYVLGDHAAIMWLFAVPNDYTAEFIIARQNRFRIVAPLPLQKNPEILTKALGEPATSVKVEDGGTHGVAEAPELGSLIISANFPNNRFYSRTQSTRDSTMVPEAGPVIDSGSGTLNPPLPGNRYDPEIIVKSIRAPKQYTVVQLPLVGEQAFTYLKAAMNLAAQVQPIYLEDSTGQKYSPVGYMINKGEKMEFKLDPENGFQTVSQISGVNMLTKAETIWLVFYVPKGIRITKFVAATKKANVSLDVPQ
jgi:hypothetical protein